MRKFIVSILLLYSGPLWASLGTPVPFAVVDRSTQSRPNEPTTTGIPLSSGVAITDVRNLMVTTAPGGLCSGGTAVDSHILVTGRWYGAPTDTTKNIKWILVDLLPTASSLGTSTYCLADRSGGDPGTAPVVTVTTSAICSANCMTVNTTSMSYTIRGDYFTFLDSMTLNGGSNLLSPDNNRGFKITVGTRSFTSANAGDGTVPYTATIEEPNTGGIGHACSSSYPCENEAGENLRSQIKVTGALWEGGVKKFRYIARIISYGGSTRVKMYLTNIFSEDMWDPANRPSDMALVMPNNLGNSLTATFGTQYQVANASVPISMNRSDDAYILQYDHGTVGYTAPNEPGWRVVKNGVTNSSGTQSDGWSDLNDGSNGITLWMRENWQLYPNEYEMNGSTMVLHFWPLHGNTFSDLATIYPFKRDMALSNHVDGFSHYWPYSTSTIMDFTPQAPKPQGGTVYSVINGSPTIIAFNGTLTDGAVGINCVAGTGCIYWNPGETHRVYITGFTGAWLPINGFMNATSSGTKDVNGHFNFIISSPTGDQFDSTTWGIPTFSGKNVATIDYEQDMNMNSWAKTWEVQLDFHSGTGGYGATAAKMRDRIFLSSPTYFCDTGQAFGRLHARDPVNFKRAEDVLDAAWSNEMRKDTVEQNYGLIYWGETQYAQGGGIVSGFGGRYWVIARRAREFAPFIQFIRTGDPKFLHYGEAWSWNSSDIGIQHPAADQIDNSAGTYTQTDHFIDVHNVLNVKRPGGMFCTHSQGNAMVFPTYGGLTPLGLGGSGISSYDCSEGQEPPVDIQTDGLMADYFLTGFDRAKELALERADQMIWVASGGDNILDEHLTIYHNLAGRAYNGCWQCMVDAYLLSGSTNYIGMAPGSSQLGFGDRCFQAGIQEIDNPVTSMWYSNPAGYILAQNPGNNIGWSYFANGWTYMGFPEYADLIGSSTVISPPSYAVGSPAPLNPQVAEVRYGKMAAADVESSTQTGIYSWQFGGKPMAYAYHYTHDPNLLKYISAYFTHLTAGVDVVPNVVGCNALGSSILSGSVPVTNCTLNYAAPDIHYFSNFTENIPYMEYELIGVSTAVPDMPAVWMYIPTTGTAQAPLTFLTRKDTDQNWNFKLFMEPKDDSGGEFEGATHPKSGDIIVDVIDPTGTEVSGYPKIQKSPNVFWPVSTSLPTSTSCLSAVDPPSITYDGAGNNIDNRLFTFNVPSDGKTGEYKINVTVQKCGSAGYTTIHDVAPVSCSLGKWEVVLSSSPNYQQIEPGGTLYFNALSTATQIKVDSSGGFSLVDPLGTIYHQGAAKTVPGDFGIFAMTSDPSWQDLAGFKLEVSGVKPLGSPSPQYYFDSPNYSPLPYTLISSAITLTFGCGITTSSLPHGSLSVPYSQTLQSGGCSAPLTWSIIAGSLPGWASLNSVTGVISGTPNVAATSNFTVKVVDNASNSSTMALSLTVDAPVTTPTGFDTNIIGNTKVQGLTTIE